MIAEFSRSTVLASWPDIEAVPFPAGPARARCAPTSISISPVNVAQLAQRAGPTCKMATVESMR